MNNMIFEQIPGYLFWKDTQGNFLGCNENFAQVSGLDSAKDIIGKTDYDFPWAYTEADFYRKDDAGVISNACPKLNFKETQSRAEGVYVCVLTSKVPLFDENKKVMGVLGMAQDLFKSNNMHVFNEMHGTFLDKQFFEQNKLLLLSHLNKAVNTSDLTIKEIECLSLWLVGHSAKESAVILHVAQHDIEIQRESIKAKMHMNSDAQMIELVKEQKIFNLFLLFSRITICAYQSTYKNPKHVTKLKNSNINLSVRESECLHYLIRGKTAKSIANLLNLSPRTIENYIDKLKIKMGVSYKNQIIEKAMSEFEE